MTNTTRKTDSNYLKMKVVLAAGGLVATLIGARLLGNEAATTSGSTAVPATTPTVQRTLAGSSTQEMLVQSLPDIKLEAIPTASAHSFQSAPVAMSRSSG